MHTFTSQNSCQFQRAKISKLFFLICLALLACYPITDACADVQCVSSSVSVFDYLNDPDDAAVTNELKLQIAADLRQNTHDSGRKTRSSLRQHEVTRVATALSQLVLVSKAQSPLADIKNLKSRCSVSSTLSPPAKQQ